MPTRAEHADRADTVVPAAASQIALVLVGVPALRAAAVIDILIHAAVHEPRPSAAGKTIRTINGIFGARG
jgi:hypothetical protein